MSGLTSGARAAPITTLPVAGTEPELQIELWRDEMAVFTGTSAQLQAEGLIPDGLEWPKAAAHMRWEAGGLSYWLRRTRPEGHRGPMSSWLELDSWSLQTRAAGSDYRQHQLRGLERKAKALLAEYHRHTAAGAQEWNAAFLRYCKILEDERYQAFKRLVPGLVPPKRGHKRKGQTATTGHVEGGAA